MYLLYIHYTFTIYSLYVHYMLTIYSLYVILQSLTGTKSKEALRKRISLLRNVSIGCLFNLLLSVRKNASRELLLEKDINARSSSHIFQPPE